MSHVEQLVASAKKKEPTSPCTLRLATSQLNLLDKFAATLNVTRQILLAAFVADGMDALQKKMGESGDGAPRCN